MFSISSIISHIYCPRDVPQWVTCLVVKLENNGRSKSEHAYAAFRAESRLSEAMLNGPSAECHICKISEQKNICKPKYISSMLYDFKDVCSTWDLEGYTVL